MTKQELTEWYDLLKQVKNGYHVSSWDIKKLIQLNHIVMEQAHKIHNNNMLEITPLTQ